MAFAGMVTVRVPTSASPVSAIVSRVPFRTRKNVNDPLVSSVSVHVMVAFDPVVILVGMEICMASVARGATRVRNLHGTQRKRV